MSPMFDDPSTIAALAATLLATGLVAGLLAGLLGVGGGIVVVPVLFQIFAAFGIDLSVRMHLAVGTSLATIVATSIVSARSHHRKGAVDFPLLRSWGVPIFAGVLLGTALAVHVRGAWLAVVFAVVALAVAVNMALRKEGLRVADRLPRGWLKATLGVVIGSFSAMMGIGGGTLSVPILSAFGCPIRRAVGTAAAIGLVIAVPGTVGFAIGGAEVAGRPPYSLGYVNLAGFALIVPATMVAAPWGARIAHAIRPRALRIAFAIFLALTSLRMIQSAVMQG